MSKIAAYNCQQSHSRAVDFLTKSVAADAICTQESGTRLNLKSYIANTPNFACCEAYLDDPCVVVTTTKERVAKSEALPIRAGANQNRSALLVQLRTTGLIVVNVHLTSGNERRSRPELQAIVEHLDKHYAGKKWVIIGDFNHDPSGDYAKLHVAKGPAHQNGSYLDWAISNTEIKADALPRYFGADHGPWWVLVNDS